jgi:hypothetical protein
MFQIYPNGGGKVLHAWQEDLDRLSEEENQAFAEEFVTESFRNGRQPYNSPVIILQSSVAEPKIFLPATRSRKYELWLQLRHRITSIRYRDNYLF